MTTQPKTVAELRALILVDLMHPVACTALDKLTRRAEANERLREIAQRASYVLDIVELPDEELTVSTLIREALAAAPSQEPKADEIAELEAKLAEVARERDEAVAERDALSGVYRTTIDERDAAKFMADSLELRLGRVMAECEDWKRSANRLGGDLNCVRGYCVPAQQEPDLETTPDMVRRNFMEARDRFSLVNDGLRRANEARDKLRADLDSANHDREEWRKIRKKDLEGVQKALDAAGAPRSSGPDVELCVTERIELLGAKLAAAEADAKRAEKERDGNAAMCINAVAEYKRAVGRAEKAEAELAELRAKLEAAIADRWRAEEIQGELSRDIAAARADQRAVAVEELRKVRSGATWTIVAGKHTIFVDLEELDDRIAALTAPAAEPINFPELRKLVAAFSTALLDKLIAAEKKYGHNDAWLAKDWELACRDRLRDHVEKGDPRDVAAYCAFMWHHGWRTAPAADPEQCKERVWDNGDMTDCGLPMPCKKHPPDTARAEGDEVLRRWLALDKSLTPTEWLAAMSIAVDELARRELEGR